MFFTPSPVREMAATFHYFNMRKSGLISPNINYPSEKFYSTSYRKMYFSFKQKQRGKENATQEIKEGLTTTKEIKLNF
jgi:hypothetical protein